MPTSHFPLSPEPDLQQSLIGHSLTSPSIPVPSLILDRSKARRNCDAMLDVCRKLNVGFRAHVKSHKTLQLAKMQVGGAAEEKTGGWPANFIVSTVLEAEQLIGYVRECHSIGRPASILYGVPPAPSVLPRLFSLANNVAPCTINILLDNLSSFNHVLTALSSLPDTVSPRPTIGIFIKIDTGYHRAGIHPSSAAFEPLIDQILGAEVGKKGVVLQGLYSHYGHSYAGSSVEEAADGLIAELEGLLSAGSVVQSRIMALYPDYKRLILTVGATPTATVAQTLLFAESADNTTIPALSTSSISLSLLAEITSVYPPDTPGRFNTKPERLISAGSMALGREPCKAYPGWGIALPALGNESNQIYDFGAEEGKREGWIVGKVSQEHGVLVYEGGGGYGGLEVGERVLIWPNHACVAGAGFGWYVVVDEDVEGGGKVVDVWARWRGW
ncbi:hypothetical protein DM02DRAFT_534507 [Periconia macrospinosa]|uniref:D-serine dehydratase-like domain-containing protein n=1 Tax=Periconia macrospinosa TaxID=97972 RepID=A0A2V1DHT1_9PLEO|nr:hypothetical protein DM02DRAFT_534507 [Periconia macrospinosa]